jgi:solute carrier family 25 folate transporter 32
MPGDVATSPAPAPPSASSQQSHHATSARGLLCHAAAGASAGVVAATFVCPLDVIKTRFQVHGWPKLATGTIGGACLFRGILANLCLLQFAAAELELHINLL